MLAVHCRARGRTCLKSGPLQAQMYMASATLGVHDKLEIAPAFKKGGR